MSVPRRAGLEIRGGRAFDLYGVANVATNVALVGRWREIKSPVPALKLIEQGWQSGPALGAELQRLRLEEIDREAQLK